MIGLAVDGDRAAVQVFPLRDGRLVDRYSFQLENVAGEDLETIVEEFCLGYYGVAPSIPPQIVMPKEVGRPTALEEILTERRGARVEVRPAFRGDKRRLAELATKNAEHALVVLPPRTPSAGSCAGVAALEELREALNLESLPVRIECFDISTTQGAQTVGSMVVFQDAQPRKALLPEVRHQAAGRPPGRLRGPGGGALPPVRARGRAGERARLGRVVRRDTEPRRRRRGKGAAVGGARGHAPVRAAAGRRRLSRQEGRARLRAGATAAHGARTLLGRAPAPPAAARRGSPLRRRLPPPERGRRRHATRCSTTCAASGRRRRRALLTHFGSVDRILAASQEELEGVPGLPEKTARAVYAQLHKAGATVSAPRRASQRRAESRASPSASSSLAVAACWRRRQAAEPPGPPPRRIPVAR